MLIYSAIASLDGYVNDAEGKFEWAAPDPEVHAFVNDLERPIRTYLYGRRMYETMRVWETMDEDDPVMRDYAEVWRAADKIVFSRTLPEVTTPSTRLEREFDPELVRGLEGTVSVGGPGLASAALTAGIVDEVQLILHPVIIGGGTPALPDGVRADLELREMRRFGSGAVFLRYTCKKGV